jgi:hypothetical protein
LVASDATIAGRSPEMQKGAASVYNGENAKRQEEVMHVIGYLMLIVVLFFGLTAIQNYGISVGRRRCQRALEDRENALH